MWKGEAYYSTSTYMLENDTDSSTRDACRRSKIQPQTYLMMVLRCADQRKGRSRDKGDKEGTKQHGWRPSRGSDLGLLWIRL